MFRSLMHGPFFVENRPYQEERLPRNEYARYRDFSRSRQAMQWQATSRLLSEMMGGAIPPEVNMRRVKDVLDIACDDGGWSYEVALRYPSVRVCAIDKSLQSLEDARTYAGTHEVNNVEYIEQDIEPFEVKWLTKTSYHLIHMRCVAGELAPDGFPNLLKSLYRLCTPHGYLLWTEAELPITNSAIYNRYFDLLKAYLQLKERPLFIPDRLLGITAFMQSWMQQSGFKDMTAKTYLIDYTASKEMRSALQYLFSAFVYSITPRFIEAGLLTKEENDALSRQIVTEHSRDDFRAVCTIHSLLGVKGRK